MIKLFSLKQQKKDEEGSTRPGGSQKKASAAQLRITKGTLALPIGTQWYYIVVFSTSITFNLAFLFVIQSISYYNIRN